MASSCRTIVSGGVKNQVSGGVVGSNAAQSALGRFCRDSRRGNGRAR